MQITRACSAVLFEGLESRRLLSSGVAADLSFGGGGDGRVIADLNPAGTSSDWLTDASTGPDGKVTLIGSAYFDGGDHIGIARYNANGTPDQTFGDHGQVRYPVAAYPASATTYTYPDGSFLVAAELSGRYSLTLALVRFNANGSIDSSFGVDGERDLNGAGGRGVTVLSDGRILVGGYTVPEQSSPVGAVWRFSATGAQDWNFGDGGRVTYPGTTSVSKMTTTPSGQVLAVTSKGLTRLDADGSTDLSFGGKGSAAGYAGGDFYAVKPDGGLVVAVAGYGVTRVFWWDADGHYDPAHDTGVQVASGATDRTIGLVLQPDGKIVVGADSQASGHHGALLARLLPSGQLDTSFAYDGRYIEEYAQTATDQRQLLVAGPGGSVIVAGITGVNAAEDPTTTYDKNFIATRYVLDPAIEVSTGGPYGVVDEGSTYTVSASGTAAGGQITKYEWSTYPTLYGFKAVASGQTTSLKAPDDPGGRIYLRVTTSTGLQMITATDVATRNVPPVASAGPDRVAAVGAPVTLTFTGTDAVVEAQTLTIDWGDGTAPDVKAFPNLTVLKITQALAHTYAARGVYSVTLTVSDGDGGVASDTASVRVGDIAASLILNKDGTEVHPATRPDAPLVGQRVYLDLDRDGQYDDGEPAGTSDSNGEVLFDGLAAGTYSIRADGLDGYEFWKPTGGAIDGAVSPAAGASAAFYYTRLGILTGTVYDDANGNGTRDPGEGPVAGMTLYYYGVVGGNPSPNGVTTDANGVFRTPPIEPGTYLVEERFLTGWVQTAPAAMSRRIVVVGAGSTASTEFGNRQVAASRITGTAWNDEDGDGVRDQNERQAGLRKVYLDADGDGQLDPEEYAVGTGSIGDYTIPNLPAGTYTVRFEGQEGWSQLIPTTPARAVTVGTGMTSAGNDFCTRKFDFTLAKVISAQYVIDGVGQALRIEFDGGVNPPTISLINLTAQVPIALVASRDASGRVVTYRPKYGPMPDGLYRAEFKGSYSDSAGNSGSATTLAPFQFSVLNGDVDGDGEVGFGDLVAVAQHYDSAGASPGEGDVNFDGRVDFEDLVVVAQKYGAVAAPIPAPAIALSAPAAKPSNIAKPAAPAKVFSAGPVIAVVKPKPLPVRPPTRR